MIITRITKEGGVKKVTPVFDTARIKEKIKEAPERIEELNDAIDRKIDAFTGWLCDLIG